ncbi:MAG: penicillin binding protein PBP4B, partial [Pseudoalteromonas tetraodonis]
MINNKTYYKVVILLLSIIIAGCSRSTAIKSERPLTANHINALANAQVIATFPEPNPSSREYVNNRGTFKAYRGRGQLLLQNVSAVSADIYINNKKLSLNEPLRANTEYDFNLGHYTHNGVNTFKVENIQPA